MKNWGLLAIAMGRIILTAILLPFRISFGLYIFLFFVPSIKMLAVQVSLISLLPFIISFEGEDSDSG